MIRVLGMSMLLCCGLAQGQTDAQASAEAVGLLRKIYQATEKLSYSGTFVYQQGDRSETSRITRLAGPGGGVERVEVLDGMPREIVRTRDTVRCYLPESQTVKVDRTNEARTFPAMLPEHISELTRSYTITRGETVRIAGFDCEAVVLTPRDELRYGYKLWADVNTGMLLKARTFNRKGETVDQFSFVQLAIGNVSRESVKTRHLAQKWRVEDAAVAPANLARSGWKVGAELPGFRKVIEVTRRLGEARPVGQMVYSDGLAAVSVFIEPMAGRTQAIRPGPSSLGAFQIYTREVANHIVTVVGEAPAASVQRIAAGVEYRKPQ
ncbi:MAG: MucB/RseB C-terminal domain-containing protein [Candidatus Parcubacteria bacterium]|nr:MucB/RseB C-terminal domain-containing protein [Burkholderiales bacterium]